MSQLVQTVTAVTNGAADMETAKKALMDAYQHLSPREAENTVQDILEFGQGKMKESELEHWLKERGLG
jgi:L-serine deaminase